MTQEMDEKEFEKWHIKELIKPDHSKLSPCPYKEWERKAFLAGRRTLREKLISLPNHPKKARIRELEQEVKRLQGENERLKEEAFEARSDALRMNDINHTLWQSIDEKEASLKRLREGINGTIKLLDGIPDFAVLCVYLKKLLEKESG
jgi:hypothetical protein